MRMRKEICYRKGVRKALKKQAKADQRQIISGILRGKKLLDYLGQLIECGKYYGNELTYDYLLPLCGQGLDDSWTETPVGGLGYQPTPLEGMVLVIKSLKLSKKDVFYDLGSGRGIFTNLVGLTTKCQVRGIEFSKKRATDSRKLSKLFGVDNVRTINANVLDVDFSDGTVFYMFNPFGHILTNDVADKIRETASDKAKIVTFFGPDMTMLGFPKFKQVVSSEDYSIGFWRNQRKEEE